MIEELIKQLIAALNANTAALTGAVSTTGAAAPATTGEPAKRTRTPKAEKPIDPTPAAESPPATEAPPADAAVTKEQLVAAAEALRNAHDAQHIRDIMTANGLPGGRVSEQAGKPVAVKILKDLIAKKAELDKAKVADPV